MNYIPVVDVSRNLLIYIFLVLQSIPVSVTGCLKRSSGSQDSLAHTVIRQEWENHLIQIDQHLPS